LIALDHTRGPAAALIAPGSGSTSGERLPGRRWNAIVHAARSNAVGAVRARTSITDAVDETCA
jgi:hypothetical protein